MTSRLLSLLIWALVAASAVTWGLKLLSRSAAVPSNAMMAQTTASAMGPIERLLGRAPAPAQSEEAPAAPVDSRFKLLGVVAARSPRDLGWALISVDGQTPRAVALGHEIEPGVRLLSVAHRRIELGAGAGAPVVALELPLLPEAARGRPGDDASANAQSAPGHVSGNAAPGSPAAVLAAPVRGAPPVGPTTGADMAARGAQGVTPPHTSMPVTPTDVAAQLAAQQAARLATQQATQRAAQQAQQAQMQDPSSASFGVTAEQQGQASEAQTAPPPPTTPRSRSVPLNR